MVCFVLCFMLFYVMVVTPCLFYGTGVQETNMPLENNTGWKASFQGANLGGGEQFLQSNSFHRGLSFI